MKNKTKVVVALASLLAVTGGIGAYSTFAWFSTTNQATVNVNSLQVYNRGNFTINFSKNDLTAGTGNASSDSQLNIADANAVTAGSEYTLKSSVNNALDISGDGSSFIRPKWQSGYAGSKVQDIANAYETITNTTTTKYFLSFDMNFKNNGAGALRLVLDKGSSVLGVDNNTDLDKYAAYSTRVSFTNLTDNKVHVWQYATNGADTATFGDDSTNVAGYGYVYAKAAGTAYKGTATKDTGIEFGRYATADHLFFTGDAASAYTDTSVTTDDPRYLGDIPAANGSTTGELKVRVSLWIEGTLKTTVDKTDTTANTQSIVGGKVNTKMVLTGIAAA